MDACFPLQDMDTIYYYSAFPGLTRYYTKMDIISTKVFSLDMQCLLYLTFISLHHSFGLVA